MGDVAITIAAIPVAAVSIKECKTGRNCLPRRGEASCRQRCPSMNAPWLPNLGSAHGQIGRARHNSDRQREFRWALGRSGFGADKRSRQRRSNRYCQAAAADAGRKRKHASQVVVQGTALIVGIAAIMLVRLSTLVMDVMMVDVSGPAGLGHVGSNILVILEGVLDMGADQRHDTGDLGQQQEPQERRTETPKLSQREHLWLHQPSFSQSDLNRRLLQAHRGSSHYRVYRTDQAPRLAKFDVDARCANHRSAIRSSE
jgi:hypothetical protein